MLVWLEILFILQNVVTFVGIVVQDLVPCVLVTFDKEQIVVWRGKNYNGNTQPSSEEGRFSAQATELSLLTECYTDYYASSVDHVSDPNAMKHNSVSITSWVRKEDLKYDAQESALW